MQIKNGRATYAELREKYEKVCIRHHLNKDGTARTICLLIKEGNVYVGIAKFSNRTFNFSKKKGRAMAQGRAEHAHAVASGKVDRRESQEKRREKLSYTVTSSEDTTTENIVSGFLENDEA